MIVLLEVCPMGLWLESGVWRLRSLNATISQKLCPRNCYAIKVQVWGYSQWPWHSHVVFTRWTMGPPYSCHMFYIHLHPLRIPHTIETWDTNCQLKPVKVMKVSETTAWKLHHSAEMPGWTTMTSPGQLCNFRSVKLGLEWFESNPMKTLHRFPTEWEPLR